MSRTAAKTETAPDASFAATAQCRGQRDRATARPAAGRKSLAEGEIARPQRIIEAMRYSSLGGGKRLRPFLTIETAALFGVRARARADGRRRDRTACIAIRWCTTTCRRWTTTTCAAAGRPCTRNSTRRPRSSPATACSPSPSTCWPAGDPSRCRRAHRAGHRARPRRRPRRHGRRPDARSRRRRPLRQERHAAGREGRADAAGDEDRRDPEVLLRRRRDPRQRAEGQARRGRAATAR